MSISMRANLLKSFKTWWNCVSLNPLYLLLVLGLLWGVGGGAEAAAPRQAGFPTSPQLRITAVDVSRLPMVQLRVLGRSADGSPIDFAERPLGVNHGGEEIPEVEVSGREDVGTLTIFVVDTAIGVEGQLETIQAALADYAGGSYMREQVDYVAIYQVGSLTGQQLLEPTPFFNTITNFLVDPLPVATGPTALIDSIMGILNSVDQIKPNPELDVSLVVVSDGTDVVSSQFNEADLLARSVALGVPIHTILIDNVAIAGADQGARFMEQVAAITGGVAARLSEGAVPAIWERIVSFRAQTLLRYRVPNPAAGDNIPVLISLADDPAVQAGTTVAVSPTAGLLTLEIPADSRALTLPDLGDGVELRLPGTVSWLDGEARELAAVQLWSNGVPLLDVDPADLASFDAMVNNFRYGSNEIWLTGVDETGREMASPVVVLTVIQGDERQIPEAIQPAGFRWGGWLAGCLFGIVLLFALFWWFFLRGAGGLRLDRALDVLPRGGSRRSRRRGGSQAVRQGPAAAGQTDGFGDGPPAPAGFVLDVVEAVTPLPSPLPLRGDEILLGRSPSQVDFPFEHDVTVSRVHARLLREGDTYRIFDEGSTSGTLANGQLVPDYGALLIDGDEVQIGAVRLRYRIIWDLTR